MKALLFLFLAFPALLSAREISSSRPDLTRNVTETVLPNGLKVIIKEEKSVPLVGLSVTYKAGYRNETEPGLSGMTHLLEHMMFKGSSNYRKGEIARTLSDAGADFNAFTVYDKTLYWEIMPRGAFETAVKIEADRMANALFEPSEFESEKRVVLSELTRHESNPGVRLSRALGEAAYGGHPRAHLYGRIEDIRNADRDRVYRDLYKKYYCPNNAYVIVVGNISARDALKTVRAHFGKIPANPELTAEKPNPIPFRAGQTVRLEGVASEDFGYQVFGLPAWNMDDPEFVALLFASQTGLLGRFWYDVTMDGGIGHIPFGKEPEYPARTVDRGYVEQNLPRLKEKFFRQETLDYDSVRSIMMTLAWMERFSGWRSYEKMLRGFAALTADDIVNTVRKYFTRENSSTGYFRATRRDARLAAGQSPPADGGYAQDIDFSDLENPTPDAVKKSRALGDSVFRDTLRSVSDYLSDVTKTNLANGLTVIHKPYTLNRKVALYAGIRAGTLHQKSPAQADLTWQMVFEGGPQIVLKNALSDLGASFSGGANANYSSVELTLHEDDLPRAVELLTLSLTNRSFHGLVLEEKKFNAIRALDEFRRNPDATAHARHEIRRMVYEKSGPGLDAFATAADYLDTTLTNIRDYYDSFYRPENMVIVVTGRVPLKEVLGKISASLGRWKPPAPAPDRALKPRAALPLAPEKDSTNRVTLPVMQSIVMMAAPSAPYSDMTNYIALSLANQIFGGGGLTSRLSRTIRDRHGLTYGVYTYLVPVGDESVYYLFMQNAGRDVPLALRLYRDELERYRTEGPNDLEIAKFKTSLLSGVVFHYENSPSIANQLLYFEMRRNDPRGDGQFIRILHGLDRDRIMNAVRSGFPARYFISIAGE